MNRVYRFSNQPKKKKTKGYSLKHRPRYDRFRKHKTITEKQPVINSKNDGNNVRKRVVKDWETVGTVMSKLFDWRDTESIIPFIMSDLSAMGLDVNYKNDMHFILTEYIANYITNFKLNGYTDTFETWWDSTDKPIGKIEKCNSVRDNVYGGIGINKQYCMDVLSSNDNRQHKIGVSIWKMPIGENNG